MPPGRVKRTVQLEIKPDVESMWQALRGKSRNMIRRAERAGVSVISGDNQVETLYCHYRENMTRLGVTIHSERFFRSVVRAFGPDCEILVAVRDGSPIGSMLLLFAKEAACFPIQNANADARTYAPIQLLNWEAMQRCAARGISQLDMGESREDSPVYKSKVNFGGTPRDLSYYDVSITAPLVGQSPLTARIFSRAQGALQLTAGKYCPDFIRSALLERLHSRGRIL